MGFLKSLAYLLPIRMGRRRDADFTSLSSRIICNRRDPNSGVVLLGDALENTRDEFFGLIRRAPNSAIVLRDEHNHIRGSASPLDRRRS